METLLLIIALVFGYSKTTTPPKTIDELDAVCASSGEAERLCGVARDMVAAVDGATRLPFTGPAAKRASVVALLTVAIHESGLRASVQDCSLCERDKSACDGGRSVSLYQLMTGRAWRGHSRDELCTDNALATTLALSWLAHFSKGGVVPMFRSYAGCPRKERDCRASSELRALFDTLATKAGVVAVPRCGPRYYRLAVSSEHGCENEGK